MINWKKVNSNMKAIVITKVFTLLLLAKLWTCLPCNSFPKIFGGNAGHTYLRQIDVYGDYMAMGGDTNDNTLTGFTSAIPYIAMMSI